MHRTGVSYEMGPGGRGPPNFYASFHPRRSFRLPERFEPEPHPRFGRDFPCPPALLLAFIFFLQVCASTLKNGRRSGATPWSGRVGPGRAGPGRAGSGRVGLGWVGSGRVKLRFGSLYVYISIYMRSCCGIDIVYIRGLWCLSALLDLSFIIFRFCKKH